MPAPAVIPAPIAYINAAAVKKLVVGSRVQVVGCHAKRRAQRPKPTMDLHLHQGLHSINGGNGALRVGPRVESAPRKPCAYGSTTEVTVNKPACPKQAFVVNGKAWNNKASILSEHFVGFLPEKEKFKLSDSYCVFGLS